MCDYQQMDEVTLMCLPCRWQKNTQSCWRNLQQQKKESNTNVVEWKCTVTNYLHFCTKSFLQFLKILKWHLREFWNKKIENYSNETYAITYVERCQETNAVPCFRIPKTLYQSCNRPLSFLLWKDSICLV